MNMEQRIIEIEKKIDKIVDNELAHLKEDNSQIKREIGIIKTNVDWLMRFFWIIATASIGSLIAAIIGIIIK